MKDENEVFKRLKELMDLGILTQEEDFKANQGFDAYMKDGSFKEPVLLHDILKIEEKYGGC